MQKYSYEPVKLSNNLMIDFNKLAILSPQLRPFVVILGYRSVCSFVDQKSLIALTKAILKNCCGVQWNCPLANLCPRVPSRFNYLLWIHLQINIPIKRVLDVGTGATLIYPLLGNKIFDWKFIATQINQQSYSHSSQIIKVNRLKNEIDLRLAPAFNASNQYEDSPILLSVINPQQQIDVLVCNPPFFECSKHTISQMSPQQHHVDGGQYSFFFTLYRESYSLPNIKYFSCLIGRLSSYFQIRAFMIKQHQKGFIQMLKFGQIEQGNNKRFIVAWRLPQATSESSLTGFSSQIHS